LFHTSKLFAFQCADLAATLGILADIDVQGAVVLTAEAGRQRACVATAACVAALTFFFEAKTQLYGV
jgi:hypothetical protein